MASFYLKYKMEFEEIIVLKVLALGLINDTSIYRIEYLLKKLYGLDSLSLDHKNSILFRRIDAIAQKLR